MEQTIPITTQTGGERLGIVAMLVAMALLPASDAMSKHLAAIYPPEQVAWVRNAVHAALMLPYMIGYRHLLRVSRRRAGMHLLRGVAFVLMTLCYIAALAWMPLANALAIVFLFPLAVTAVSSVFMGERVGAVRWLAVAVGLCGILLVVRPGYGPFNPGIGFAIGAALMTALYILMTRSMSAQTPRGLLLAVPAWIGTIVLIPVLPWRWTAPAPLDWAMMAAVGGIAALAHFLIIVAYSRAEASAVAPLSYLQIVFGVLIGILVFGDVPDALTTLGIGIVLASGIVISLREARRARTQESAL